MFISVLEKRKNISNLFDAFAKAYSKIKIPLVIIGGKGYGYEDIMAHYNDLPENIKDHIIFTGFIEESDKNALLTNARAFVFPSIYEGLGLPVLEALVYGLPVLTSFTGALPEAGGKAALYINNPYDVNEIAEGIEKITLDTNLRSSLKQHIPEQLDKFSQEKFNQRFNSSINGLDR